MQPNTDNVTVTTTDNLNVVSTELLLSPKELKDVIPMTTAAEQTVLAGRQAVQAILDDTDPRLFIVVGPCSIHDLTAAREYATRLKALADELQGSLLIIMRVYFEKPRTTLGWKGLINDPNLDGTFQIVEGLHIGRGLLLELAELGLPTATEALDPISPQYLQDLITWSAIGARTTESQTHREMSSGLSSPIGFKNGTDGSLDVAVNAIQSAKGSHRFLGVNAQGRVAIVHTRGNNYTHVVLRGGQNGPNYDSEHVNTCEDQLSKLGLRQKIMIDASHANSNKDPKLQTVVIGNTAEQLSRGNKSICGLMIESHLNWGSQKIPENKADLKYGVSVTDACMDFETTATALRELAKAVTQHRLS